MDPELASYEILSAEHYSPVVALTGPFCSERYNVDEKRYPAVSTRLVQRFMCSEFICSLLYTMFSSGAVLSSGVISNHLDFSQGMDGGRKMIIALCNGLLYTTLLLTMIRFSEPLDPRSERKHLVGHFNPAVSIAMYWIGDIDYSHLCGYLLHQFFGAAVGIVLLLQVVPDAYNTGIGATEVNTNVNFVFAILVEFILTASIIWVICVTLVMPMRKHDNKMIESAPLWIGITVTIATILSSNISGGSFNPARSIAPLFISGSYLPMIVYLIGPMTGAIFAAHVYKTVEKKLMGKLLMLTSSKQK